jgi:hypothetical protein
LVAQWLPRFEELRRNHPSLPGIARAAAQLHFLAGEADAPALTNAWFAEADSDPEALLWRMRVRLRNGALPDASDDAVAAVQESVAPEQTLRDVVQVWQEGAGNLEGGFAAAARIMQRKFRDLLERGTAVGGPR